MIRHTGSGRSAKEHLYSPDLLLLVGRHAVAAALELPRDVVPKIRVFSKDVASLELGNWKCGCGIHSISQEDRERLEFIQLDLLKDDIVPVLMGVQALVSCLGSRQPFHAERIVRKGTERLVEAALKCRVSRFVMISSVVIADDWPPMHVSISSQLATSQCSTTPLSALTHTNGIAAPLLSSILPRSGATRDNCWKVSFAPFVGVNIKI